MLARSLLIAAALIATRAVVAGRDPVRVPTPAPLVEFPRAVEGWRGSDLPPLDDETARVLAADAYLNRVYVADGGVPIALFIAYYESQQAGAAIHSPKNCLPGNGWQAVSHADVALETRGGPIRANRYVVERGARRQLVWYWFQSRGRTTASEYLNKFYLMVDAVRVRRTNGALVRLVAPIVNAEGDADAAARRFAETFDHALRRWLP